MDDEDYEPLNIEIVVKRNNKLISRTRTKCINNEACAECGVTDVCRIKTYANDNYTEDY